MPGCYVGSESHFGDINVRIWCHGFHTKLDVLRHGVAPSSCNMGTFPASTVLLNALVWDLHYHQLASYGGCSAAVSRQTSALPTTGYIPEMLCDGCNTLVGQFGPVSTHSHWTLEIGIHETVARVFLPQRGLRFQSDIPRSACFPIDVDHLGLLRVDFPYHMEAQETQQWQLSCHFDFISW